MPDAQAPSKARIRRSFERAAATYDSAADVQRRICQALAGGLPAGLAPRRVLDAGCGTGYARALLAARFPAAAYVGLDLAPAMLAHLAAPCQRIAGDLDKLPLATASIDLYWSSLAVQWCDLARSLGEARRVLRPGGHLALASLGPATFHELRMAFADVDPYRHTLAFETAENLARQAAFAGLHGVAVEQRREVACYPDFRSLLHAVKAIGANQLGAGRRTSLLSRSAFNQAAAASETTRSTAGLPLTYDVLILTAHA